MQLIQRLWNDEAGFVVSSELILIATLLVIGMLVGLATVRDSVIQELGDVANAIGLVNQSYSFSGITGHNSSTSGSIFTDAADQCETTQTQTAGSPPLCLSVTIAPSTSG